MSLEERVSAAITDNAAAIIIAMLVVTAGLGWGAQFVEQSSDLSQFESDSEAAEKSAYIAQNFSQGQENTTTVQIIVRDDNVLSKAALLDVLRYEQALRDDGTISGTLTENRSTAAVANIVATTAIVQERQAEFQQRGAELERRNQSLAADARELRQDRQALQERSDQLNDTARHLGVQLKTVQELQRQYYELNQSYSDKSDPEYQQKAAALEAQIAAAKADATQEAPIELSARQGATFNATASDVRSLQQQLDELNASFAAGEISESEYRNRSAQIGEQLEAAFQAGTRGVLREEFATLQEDAAELQERGAELQQRQQALREDFGAFQADIQEFRENPPDPTLEAQVEQLESMNESAVADLVSRILQPDSDVPGGEAALNLMPKDYEPGTASASSTMIFVTQTTDSNSAAPGSAGEDITDAQLRMQDIAQDRDDGLEYVVFGGGIISDEISRSMQDSLTIIGPMAIVFVLLTLLIAYRDLIDIALGLFGIATTLIWTFGFMGLADIAFNQILIAVPVLLIGLAIDYAIHIFMRHREARMDDETGDESVKGSMTVALGGVGVALVWVTATTVIGFMSNLTSPLGPIQDFGVVSSFGILAALLIFGAFVPALKILIDGAIENRLGWDRKKRAFGTGGGSFSKVLSVGSTAAERAPAIVIAIALLLTVAGAAGATQVETTFENSDFLADDPPEWMDELPEPFAPGEYNAKENLNFVYQNFQSPDRQADLLIEESGGDAASAAALERVAAAEERAASDESVNDVVFVGPSGEPSITSPLSVMEEVAAQNESFNATYQAADTDGDGVPDRNVEAVYDELFRVAPDQASSVIYRTEDGDYRALKLTVSLQDANSAEVKSAMDELAAEASNDEFEATATGTPIINEIVQTKLLNTVIESLIITLVAVFAFLMLAYRVTEGSATLGAVTLLPVALSVAWILGTMYLLGIPFNVITGTITSLTIGLGVAYSIHVSERYNLELERRDGDVWSAMERSVTGTGGALLGSAATTAGGFGVLAFAIFPALQSFGIITGITIIYAFVASVFVLPSLLVVWTRYFGPEDAVLDRSATVSDDDLPPDAAATANGGEVTSVNGGAPTPEETTPTTARDDAPGAAASAGDDAAAGDDETTSTAGEADETATADAGGPTATADEQAATTDEQAATVDEQAATTDEQAAPADEAPDDSTPTDGDESAGDESDDADASSVAAATAAAGATATTDDDGVFVGGAGSRDPATADRSVSPDRAAPGEEFVVSLVANDSEGRVVLRETVPGVGGQVDSFDPSPDHYTKVGRTLYAVWDLAEPTDVGVTYRATVPEDAKAGETLSFDGSLLADDGDHDVEGVDEIRVVTAFLAEALAADEVDDATLAEAGRRANDGDLAEDELQEIYRRWLGVPDEDAVGDR